MEFAIARGPRPVHDDDLLRAAGWKIAERYPGLEPRWKRNGRWLKQSLAVDITKRQEQAAYDNEPVFDLGTGKEEAG